jgi:hypothetical protein
MMQVTDLITAPTRAGKSKKEIKPLVDGVYEDKALSISHINRIIKAVKKGKAHLISVNETAKRQRKLTTMWTRTIAAAIVKKNDQRLIVRELFTMLGLP